MLGMPLSELSRKVGVSVSALSQIENAKAFPSVITLKTIANSLHTSVGDLIGEFEDLAKNPLIKAEEIKYVKTNDTDARLYLLSHHDNGKQMEPYMIKFPQGADSADIMTEHSGQGFIYVVEGKLLASLNHIDFKLEKGDSFYFNSNIGHQLKNVGKSEAKVIWVISPPHI
jgi:XRE family transcriptional regulator, regulator of sulfur utilization